MTIETFLLGVVLGFISIGTTTLRTIKTHEGIVSIVILSNIVYSFSYYFGIKFVTNDQLDGFIGFSVGATLATTLMALKYKIKRRKNENTSPGRETNSRNKASSIEERSSIL